MVLWSLWAAGNTCCVRESLREAWGPSDMSYARRLRLPVLYSLQTYSVLLLLHAPDYYVARTIEMCRRACGAKLGDE